MGGRKIRRTMEVHGRGETGRHFVRLYSQEIDDVQFYVHGEIVGRDHFCRAVTGIDGTFKDQGYVHEP